MSSTRLSQSVADKVAQLVAERLEQSGILPRGTGQFRPEEFHPFRARVREAFYVPQTSITPLMARVLFTISAAHKPSRIVALGSYVGNALVWLAGPTILGFYSPEGVWGIDIDADALRLARTNMMALQAPSYIQQICCDAHEIPERLGGMFDLVYIDVEAGGKRIYHTILEKIYPSLNNNALVLAHDACVVKFQQDLKPYFAMVRDKRLFRLSATLDIDYCGVEVTVR